MRPPALTSLLAAALALPASTQAPPTPGKALDVREAPKTAAEEAKAKKAREHKMARLEALKQAKAAELTRAYVQEQERQAALKAAKVPTTGVLVLGETAPAAPAPTVPTPLRPTDIPRTPEELLTTLRALALLRDADNCRWEVVSFDGRTLVLERTGANFRKRFRIPLAEVVAKPERTWVNQAWQDARGLRFESRDYRMAYTTTYTTGSNDEGKENHVCLPVADGAAAARVVKDYLAQAAPKP